MTFKLISISPLRTGTQTGLTNKKQYRIFWSGFLYQTFGPLRMQISIGPSDFLPVVSECEIVRKIIGHSVWWTKMIHQTESTFARPKENRIFLNISLLMAGLYSFLYLYKALFNIAYFYFRSIFSCAWNIESVDNSYQNDIFFLNLLSNIHTKTLNFLQTGRNVYQCFPY